ncbi:hypothetical protein L596_030286 [Steinernema carpocapsae]|uniref:Uncharacterized protein n=1 Tax=Steinernema carpocapsae TaxID=34508 RepID=A0A4V5ZWY5_STECR|nr:hypothetical protein L596_030286 [Steinernema carpocapsae]
MDDPAVPQEVTAVAPREDRESSVELLYEVSRTASAASPSQNATEPEKLHTSLFGENEFMDRAAAEEPAMYREFIEATTEVNNVIAEILKDLQALPTPPPDMCGS